ncbi:hypothetical protein [Acaryochloris marina]|uniref:hypothetical protein n=1 Tax=Acaryochloris marina TaxID=155978 RepID=UPI001BAFFED5|nr:hypothetical protein [Acaryochloris marina]QUY46227.1 hypothetical protein I1H34_31410 [Acaryochloris marina S15]
MIADEIIDYFLQNAQSSPTTPDTPSLCQSIIEAWMCVDLSNNVVIRGKIHNHPKYPSGTPLRTSPIQGYFSNSGRMYVNTKNSMYELGMPHENFVGDSQTLLSNDVDMQTVQLTYWEE